MPTAAHAYQIPARPAEAQSVWDSAGLLTPAHRAAIEKRAAELDREIVVVTIRNMSQFGGHPSTLEPFAAAWFNEWGIGSRADNSGILLLISSGDRKARIELGADWGHRFDEHCSRIMQNDILPEFRGGDYSQGILNGFSRLASMSESGPTAAAPKATLSERIQSSDLVRKQQQLQPGPFWATPICIGLGILLIVLAMVYPKNMKVFLMGGFALILAGISIWLLLVAVIALVGLFSPRRGGYYGHSHWGSGSSGSSSGGFSGGGFSGGGGASGSW